MAQNNVYYHYRALSGAIVPGFHPIVGTYEDAVLSLQNDFEGTTTPLTSVAMPFSCGESAERFRQNLAICRRKMASFPPWSALLRSIDCVLQAMDRESLLANRTRLSGMHSAHPFRLATKGGHRNSTSTGYTVHVVPGTPGSIVPDHRAALCSDRPGDLNGRGWLLAEGDPDVTCHRCQHRYDLGDVCPFDQVLQVRCGLTHAWAVEVLVRGEKVRRRSVVAGAELNGLFEGMALATAPMPGLLVVCDHLTDYPEGLPDFGHLLTADVVTVLRHVGAFFSRRRHASGGYV